MDNNLATLLNKGIEEAMNGSKARARTIFRQVLSLDSTNETAMLWLAWTTDDVYEVVNLLEQVVARNPGNRDARMYLTQARIRKQELDALVSNSSTIGVWSRLQPQKFIKPKKAVPVLGEYLLREGYITPQQLESALRRHSDLAKRGTPKLVGQVLVELGYISSRQLESGLKQQQLEYSYRMRD